MLIKYKAVYQIIDRPVLKKVVVSALVGFFEADELATAEELLAKANEGCPENYKLTNVERTD